MKLFFAMGCALVAVGLAPSAAFADEDDVPRPPVTESAIDTIKLRSGLVLRGRVTEIVAGDHVSLVIPSGETWRVPWSEVDRLVVATTSFPPPPAPLPPSAPPPPPAPAPASPPPMVGPRARVHITSSGTAYLYRRAAGTSDFVTACESPCDADMPLGDSYEIGGSGLTTTKPFRLEASPGGRVELTVSGPNWLGIVSGGTLAFVGLCIPSAGSDSRHGDAALGSLAVGLLAMGLGTFIVYRSWGTDFTQKKARPGHVAFVRAPAWRSASATEQGARPTLPVLFEGRF